MFRQCQIQWFLKTTVANAKKKDLVRQEVCLPSKLHLPSLSHIGDPTALRLLEVQLLTGQQRVYRLCDQDIAAVEDFIAASADERLRRIF
jgi:hypothetical protein